MYESNDCKILHTSLPVSVVAVLKRSQNIAHAVAIPLPQIGATYTHKSTQYTVTTLTAQETHPIKHA